MLDFNDFLNCEPDTVPTTDRVERKMATIEEKRLAIEMADKIIQTRLSHPTNNIKNNSRSGEIEYWKEVYIECLKITSDDY